MMRRPIGAAAALAVIALLGLGACGGGSGSSEPTKTATAGAITVGAFDIHFDVGVIKTTAGPLTVTFVNHGAIEHTFKIDGTTLLVRAKAGSSATGAVTLHPGTYTFECTIPGHKAQMHGKVEVS